jgi:hypothetical protein
MLVTVKGLKIHLSCLLNVSSNCGLMATGQLLAEKPTKSGQLISRPKKVEIFLQATNKFIRTRF